MHEPIAYTYMADHHCEDCTREAFPESGRWPGVRDTDKYPNLPEIMLDGEGNEVGALAPWDEWWNVGEGDQTLTCSDCGAILGTYMGDEDV